MSGLKPKKRIVSKGRYVWVMGKKAALYSVSAVTFGAGFWAGILGILLLVGIVFLGFRNLMPGCTCIIIVSLLLLWVSKLTSERAEAIESVHPITDHNTHLLPPEESLVRASDTPPVVSQSELLRVSQIGQETPKEELLRMIAGDE